jgi:hypothetical protein
MFTTSETIHNRADEELNNEVNIYSNNNNEL